MTMQFKSVKGLAKHFTSLGFFTYLRSKNSITISVQTFNKQDGPFELDDAIATFNGETAQEMFEQYQQWISDPEIWIKKCRVAVVQSFDSAYDFDLAEEILKLGFKYVEVEHEDSNFVDVMCKYCYIEQETGKYRFDGELFIDDIGDKYKTLEYLQQWIMDNVLFQPTLNRL
jgi:hypothetical protein